MLQLLCHGIADTHTFMQTSGRCKACVVHVQVYGHSKVQLDQKVQIDSAKVGSVHTSSDRLDVVLRKRRE